LAVLPPRDPGCIERFPQQRMSDDTGAAPGKLGPTNSPASDPPITMARPEGPLISPQPSPPTARAVSTLLEPASPKLPQGKPAAAAARVGTFRVMVRMVASRIPGHPKRLNVRNDMRSALFFYRSTQGIKRGRST